MNAFLKIAQVMSSSSFSPIQSIGRFIDRVLGPVEKKVEDLGNYLNGVCKRNPQRFKYFMTGLDSLEYLNSFLGVVGRIIERDVSNFDAQVINDRLDSLVKLYGATECLATVPKPPNTYDEPFAKAEFYEAQLINVQSWIDQIDATGGRHRELQDNAVFYAEIAEFDEFADTVLGLGDAVKSIIEVFDVSFGDLELDTIMEPLFVDFPNALEIIVNGASKFTKGLKPLSDLLEPITKNIPQPPWPFGSVATIMENFVCGLLGPLCDIIEDFVKGIIEDLLEEAGLPNLPDPTALFGDLTNVLDKFDLLPNVNASDLTEFLPAEFAQFSQFFRFDEIELALEGFLSGLAKTPGTILINRGGAATRRRLFEDPANSLVLEGTVEVNSLVAQINCTDGSIPVVITARFVTDACKEDFAPEFRFPCPGQNAQCDIDITDLITCNVPNLDPDSNPAAWDVFLHDMIGVPVSHFVVQYYCLDNLDDWKVRPDLFDGWTSVDVVPLGETPCPDGPRIDQTDTFQRPGFRPNNIQVPLMDCTGGGRSIYLPYYDHYFDPCMNGQSFPIATQADRVGRTDLCGHKLLFDSDLLEGCDDNGRYSGWHAQASENNNIANLLFEDPSVTIEDLKTSNGVGQQRIGQKRLASRHPLRRTSASVTDKLCWQDPGDTICVVSVESNADMGLYDDYPRRYCWPFRKWELDWEKIATNLERCEVSWSKTWCFLNNGFPNCASDERFSLDISRGNDSFTATRTDRQDFSLHYCPFNNYVTTDYHGSCVRSQDNSLCYYNSGSFTSDGSLSTCFDRKDFLFSDSCVVQDEPDPEWQHVAVDCQKRKELEEATLLLEEGSFSKGVPFPTLDRSQNPYDSWKAAFDTLQEECPAKIQQCIESKCDLKAIGCVPTEFLWACGYKPSQSNPNEPPRIRRTYIFDQNKVDDFAMSISCDPQSVLVNNETVQVETEVQLVSILESTSLFTWNDVTETVRPLCTENISSCDFIPNTGRYPTGGSVWEVDYQCNCPAGFNIAPVDGVCVPCSVGHARPDEAEECFACLEGYFATEGSDACLPCPLGFFQPDKSAKFCFPCPVGYISSNKSATSCDPCAEGSFQNESAKDFCYLTPPGYFQPEQGATSALPCPGGTYSASNATECLACQPGSFSREGSADDICTPCPPGKYSILAKATECTLCNQGYYNADENQTSCTKCPEGLTTEAYGATSLNDCVNPVNPMLLEEILIDGSSPEFNPTVIDRRSMRGLNSDVIVETIPPNEQVNRPVTEVSIGCRELLKKYVIGVDDIDSQDLALQEIGNGICNRGPWNTEACAWDGGDCCPQTCVVARYDVNATEEDDKIGLLVGNCNWLGFQCIDPVALAQTTPPPRCDDVTRRDRRLLVEGRKLADDSSWQMERQEFLQAWTARQSHVEEVRRKLSTTGPSLPGDGICDPLLNTVENVYDGGDCCPQSCIPNPDFLNSCGPESFSALQGGCEQGFGCCDPLVLEREFSVADVVAPEIEAVPDYFVECDQVSALLNNPNPFAISVSDNDVCFSSDDSVTFTRQIVSTTDLGDCRGDVDRVLYNYQAQDNAGNVATREVRAIVQDTTPPFFLCTPVLPIDVTYSQTVLNLPAVVAYDSCSESDFNVKYASTDTGLTVTQDGTVTITDETKFTFNIVASSTDDCGNTAYCDILVAVVRAPAPTQAPSTSPTASPSSSPTQSPTKSPTRAPSLSPTSLPTTSPTPNPTPNPTPALPTYCRLRKIAGKDCPTNPPPSSPPPPPSPQPSPQPTPQPMFVTKFALESFEMGLGGWTLDGRARRYTNRAYRAVDGGAAIRLIGDTATLSRTMTGLTGYTVCRVTFAVFFESLENGKGVALEWRDDVNQSWDQAVTDNNQSRSFLVGTDGYTNTVDYRDIQVEFPILSSSMELRFRARGADDIDRSWIDLVQVDIR